MTDYKNEEVDIFYVLHKLKELLKRWNVLLFRGINFIIKRWYILLALIIVGFALGYYENENTEKDKKAKILLRINFDSVNYVYTSLELLNEKLAQGDNKFLKEIDFPNAPQEIKEFELTPLVNLKEIIAEYEANDRNFEAIIKNVDFPNKDDEERNISETFTSEYKYHILEFVFTHEANEESVRKIVAYLNNNELLQELKEVSVRDIKEHVAYNRKTIEQIDKVLDTYTTNESLPSPSDQIYVVDKNFSINNILEKKIELKQEIDELNKQLVYSKDIVVMVNEPLVIKLSRGFLDKKHILYPIAFVGIFIFLALLRSIYIHLKHKAEETEAADMVQ
jgi:hypothetical protein